MRSLWTYIVIIKPHCASQQTWCFRIVLSMSRLIVILFAMMFIYDYYIKKADTKNQLVDMFNKAFGRREFEAIVVKLETCHDDLFFPSHDYHGHSQLLAILFPLPWRIV